MDIRDDDRFEDVRQADTRNVDERVERAERDKMQADARMDKDKEGLERSAFSACERNMEEIEKQGFSKELLDDVKANPNLVLLDLRNEKDLLDYAKDNFSKEANKNLEELVKVDYNRETERSVIDTVKEYSIYSKMQDIEKDGNNVVNTRNITPEKLQQDAREIVDRINHLNVRDRLDRNLELSKHNKISKSVIVDGRFNRPDREKYVPNREIIKKTYQTREVSDRYKENRNLLEKWNINRDDDREKERAEVLKQAIKDINLSPVVENYILDMDKEELKEVMSNMNTRDDYEKFLDRVSDSVKPEDKVAIREELQRNEIEKMATWTKDERTVGLAKEVHVRNWEQAMQDRDNQVAELNRNTLAFREVEERLSQIADQDKYGRYIFPNKGDNIMSRIDNIDKVKSVAAINLAMTSRDDAASKRFIEKCIDPKIDSKNPQRTYNLIKSLSDDIRESRYQDALNKQNIVNGDRVYIENVRLTENKSNDIKPEKDIEWQRDRVRIADLKESDKIHKGDLNSLTNLREIREETRTFLEKEAFKDLPRNASERQKTEAYIDKLANQKSIVAKFSNPIIERDLTNGKGAERYGKEIEEKAQKYYEVAKFSDNKDLKDSIKEVIDNARNSSNKEEQKLAACFDYKDRISKAFIKGNIESIEADVRNDIGDIKPEYGQMIYKDGMDKDDVEKTVRDLVTQRAIMVPNMKDEKLQILLTQTRENDTSKERLEALMGRELNKTDMKIQGHLASMRHQEIIDRTAYALRSNDRVQANKDVNDFLKETLTQERIDGDNKLIRDYADEKFETLKYNTFVVGELSGMSDNMFNFFNSSQAREIFLDNIKDKGDNDIREEYGSYDPRGDISKDLDTPQRITENNNEYMESLLSTFKSAGINIDPKVLNIIPERNEMIGTRESVLVEKEAMDSVHRGSDTYREIGDGKYESRTMGEIDKKEVERLNQMFNNLFNVRNSVEMFSKDMNPRDAIELVSRGDYLRPLLNPSKYEQISDAYDREREIFGKNMDFLKNKLENRFHASMKRENMFMSKMDDRFKDATFKDLMDPKNTELRDYFVQRSEELRGAAYKAEAIESRNKKDLYEDSIRGIKDRRTPIEKQRDALEKEINELRQQKFILDKRIGESNARVKDLNERHQKNLQKLEEKRDEQLKGLKDGIFARVQRMKINMEYKVELDRLESEINTEMRFAKSVAGPDINESKELSREMQGRIEELKESVKSLTKKAALDNRDRDRRYANVEYKKFLRTLVNKENTLRTSDYVIPKIESDKTNYHAMKDPAVRDVYDYKTRNRIDVKLNNKIKAANERIRLMDEERKFLDDLREYQESPEGIMDKQREEVRDYYAEMERSSKDINHFIRLLEEKEPQIANELGVTGLRMPADPKDPALYEVLNNTFVKYLDVQIYDTTAYQKLEKMMGIEERFQKNPQSVSPDVTQEKIDKAIEGWKVAYGHRDLSKQDLKNIYHNPPTETLKAVKMDHDARMRELEDLARLNRESEVYNTMVYQNSEIDEDSYYDLYGYNEQDFDLSPDIIEQLSKEQEDYERIITDAEAGRREMMSKMLDKRYEQEKAEREERNRIENEHKTRADFLAEERAKRG